MSRETRFAWVVAGFLALCFAWRLSKVEKGPRNRIDPEKSVSQVAAEPAFDLHYRSGCDRVMFVCREKDAGKFTRYSPGVYLHGPDGGGPACLDIARLAAPFMRDGEPGDSAAALCGYLFKTGGPAGLALRECPQPREDGSVDWQEYCGWNVDLILIDVDQRTAECHVSTVGDHSTPKKMVARITNLSIPSEHGQHRE